MTRESVEQWSEAYKEAWEKADSEIVAELFAENGTYRSEIYQEPHRGRSGVIEYWTEVTAAQSDVEVRMGKPFVDGDRAVVEFWTTMRISDDPVTLAGSLLLDFDDTGLCTSLREYWNFAQGFAEPPTDWGT